MSGAGLEHFDKEISVIQRNLETIKGQINALRKSFVDNYVTVLKNYYINTFDQIRKHNTEFMKKLADSELTQIKAELNQLCDNAAEIVANTVGADSVWFIDTNKSDLEVEDSHKKKLIEAISVAYGYLGGMLIKHNFAVVESGWKSLGNGQYSYSGSITFDTVSEPIRRQYNDMVKSYLFKLKNIKRIENQKMEAEQDQRWNKIK